VLLLLGLLLLLLPLVHRNLPRPAGPYPLLMLMLPVLHCIPPPAAGPHPLSVLLLLLPLVQWNLPPPAGPYPKLMPLLPVLHWPPLPAVGFQQKPQLLVPLQLLVVLVAGVLTVAEHNHPSARWHALPFPTDQGHDPNSLLLLLVWRLARQPQPAQACSVVGQR
jgi:hypothetical protein